MNKHAQNKKTANVWNKSRINPNVLYKPASFSETEFSILVSGG
jgi:hypothetical protein